MWYRADATTRSRMGMPVPRIKLPPERSIRLAAGLILFAYAASHLISHATGIFLLGTLQSVGHDILLAPWRTPAGLGILLIAFLVHLGLGLWALYRRRHLRMPAIEACQLCLGLVIPLLLAPHVTDARLGVLLYGLEDSYLRILYLFFIAQPGIGLPRQFALLVAIWTHGCIGIHMWLRFRPWYRRSVAAFAVAALLLPVMAIFGIINAGWDTMFRAAVEPGFAAAHGPAASGTPDAEAGAALAGLTMWLQGGYLAMLVLVFMLRALRGWRERLRSGVCIEYRGGARITVPRGFSILEVSRYAKLPHASVCGGRGRCSTCRVRVTRGLESLPSPGKTELATLTHIRAPFGIRLACQVRPIDDIAVTPLVPVGRPLDGPRVALAEGREMFVTALHVDLRDSTRLASQRLPFDAVFIIDRYVQAVTAAIQARDGHVTSVAGDGIMSAFGINGDAASGARNALLAAEAAWRAIDKVSTDLAAEIGAPLRFGIGVHSGLSVVGAVGLPDQAVVQFLGDTGNVAARLERLTKEMNCTAVISAAALLASGLERPFWRAADAHIHDHHGAALRVFLISRPDDFTSPAPPGDSSRPATPMP
jgi:adenylate cyclase